MNLDELEAAWNAKADRHNQWRELGLDEIVAFAQEVERESARKAPSIEAARKIGEEGGSSNEDERFAFEAWMHGHCWSMCDVWWDGRGYLVPNESRVFIDPTGLRIRQIWAAWRDRAALANMAYLDKQEAAE